MNVDQALDIREKMELAEKDVARLCDSLVSMVGGGHSWVVVQTNPPHRQMQTKGVPDRRYRVYGTCLFFELKRPDGQLTREQYEFAVAELDHDCLAACGGVDELKKVLDAIRADRGKLRNAGAIAVCRAILASWSARGFRGESRRQTHQERRTP